MKKTARNAVARELATGKYALRIVTKGRGKGTYRRNEKHRNSLKDRGASSVSGGRILEGLLHLRRNLGRFSLSRRPRGAIVQGHRHRRCL